MGFFFVSGANEAEVADWTRTVGASGTDNVNAGVEGSGVRAREGDERQTVGHTTHLAERSGTPRYSCSPIGRFVW